MIGHQAQARSLSPNHSKPQGVIFMSGLQKLLPSFKQLRVVFKENPKSVWEAMTSTKEPFPTPTPNKTTSGSETQLMRKQLLQRATIWHRFEAAIWHHLVAAIWQNQMGKQLRLPSRALKTPRTFDFIILLPEIYPKEIGKMEIASLAQVYTYIHIREHASQP